MFLSPNAKQFLEDNKLKLVAPLGTGKTASCFLVQRENPSENFVSQSPRGIKRKSPDPKSKFDESGFRIPSTPIINKRRRISFNSDSPFMCIKKIINKSPSKIENEITTMENLSGIGSNFFFLTK